MKMQTFVNVLLHPSHVTSVGVHVRHALEEQDKAAAELQRIADEIVSSRELWNGFGGARYPRRPK